MTRFILAIIAIFSGLGLTFSLFVSFSSRNDGLTQAILGLGFGITLLSFALCIGFFSVLGHLARQGERFDALFKDIALSNSDAASAVKIIRSHVDDFMAGARVDDARQLTAQIRAVSDAAAGPARGRLEIEAEMLERRGQILPVDPLELSKCRKRLGKARAIPPKTS